MSIALSFLAAICWGASDFAGGFAVKKEHFVSVTLMRQLFEIVLFGALLAVVPSAFHGWEFVICLVLGMIVGVSLPIFYNALATGRMALVAPVAGLVSASLPILVGVISGERPSALKIAGLVLAVVAVVFVSVEHVDDGENGKRRHWAVSDILLALVCGVTFAAFFIVMHHMNADAGNWPVLGVCFGATITLVTWNAFRTSSVISALKVSKQAAAICGIGALVEVVAVTSYFYATHHGLLSITAAVSSLYPVFTAFLAWLVIKEKLTMTNSFGLVCSALCLAFIAAP